MVGEKQDICGRIRYRGGGGGDNQGVWSDIKRKEIKYSMLHNQA